MFKDSSVSAFSNTVYQNLGQKTFWFLVSQRVGPGLAFLAIAFVLSLVRMQSFVSVEASSLIRAVSWLSFIIALIALSVGFISSRLVYKSSGFLLADDALRIRRGVFTREETAIPYHQIQNIDIRRTMTQRIAGLSRLIIHTASGEGEGKEGAPDENVIVSIDEEVAERLQAELLKRIKA